MSTAGDSLTFLTQLSDAGGRRTALAGWPAAQRHVREGSVRVELSRKGAHWREYVLTDKGRRKAAGYRSVAAGHGR